MDNWRTRVYIIGGVLGLITGIVAANILIQRSEAINSQPQITAGDGVKVGLGVLGLLRLVAEFADRE
jgi:hypothetical protein